MIKHHIVSDVVVWTQDMVFFHVDGKESLCYNRRTAFDKKSKITAGRNCMTRKKINTEKGQ